MLILSTSTHILPTFFRGILHGLKKQNLAQGAKRILSALPPSLRRWKEVGFWWALLLWLYQKVPSHLQDTLERGRSLNYVISVTRHRSVISPSMRCWKGKGVWWTLFLWPHTGVPSCSHDTLERGRCLNNIITLTCHRSASSPSMRSLKGKGV